MSEAREARRALTRKAAGREGRHQRDPGVQHRDGQDISSPRETTRLRARARYSGPGPSSDVDRGRRRRPPRFTGVGRLTDFNPHDEDDFPTEPGVYVFYDISERPVYIGESGNIRSRIRGSHFEKFWYKRPIVEKASYVRVDDEKLRRQLEDTLIKFLKSNAVINRRQVDR